MLIPILQAANEAANEAATKTGEAATQVDTTGWPWWGVLILVGILTLGAAFGVSKFVKKAPSA